mmetsp:Transcript_460/g.507  ORF Transcript_460/g.507 Transcript_460/m.507 type:complete len:89 (+) Transcript_460:514-780(+)
MDWLMKDGGASVDTRSSRSALNPLFSALVVNASHEGERIAKSIPVAVKQILPLFPWTVAELIGAGGACSDEIVDISAVLQESLDCIYL